LAAIIFLIFLLLVVVVTILVLALVFISGIVSDKYGVSFVPTRRRNIKKLFVWAGLSADDIFYDLGCGDGRVLICAVKDFGVMEAVGYEVAPWPYIKARFLIWLFGVKDRTSVLRRDFLKDDLSSATFIYTYLSHKLVEKLAIKLAVELKPGTRILCHTFPIDLGHHPEFKLIKSEEFDKITAYLYKRI